MSNLDGNFRKMVEATGQRTDKLDPDWDPHWDRDNEVIAYPPVPGPANPSAYHRLAEKVADIVVEKQAAYGDSHGRSGDVLRILYPAGVSREAMADALTVTRVIDKLFRVATKKNAFGESPWMDVAGYALLAARRDEGGGKGGA